MTLHFVKDQKGVDKRRESVLWGALFSLQSGNTGVSLKMVIATQVPMGAVHRLG